MRKVWNLRSGRVLMAGAMIGVWTVFLSALSRHTRIGNSDNANAVLAGHDILGGNLLLHGWTLPADTYLSIDLPVYGIFSMLWGVRVAGMFVTPVLIGVAVALVAFSFARAGQEKLYRLVAVGVMFALLGLPHQFLAFFFLQGPQHVGTTLFCLFSFRLLASSPLRFRWWVGVAVLGAAVLGDPLALALGACPIAAAGAVASWRLGSWKPLRASVAATVLAVAGALVVGKLISMAGGYGLSPKPPLSPPENWYPNVKAAARLMAWLLGVGSGSGIQGLYRAFHIFGLAAFGLGVAATMVSGLRRRAHRSSATDEYGSHLGPRWLDDVLLLGLLGGIGAYVIIALPADGIDIGSARYLLAPLTYGVILTGKRAGDLVLRLPSSAQRVMTLTLVVLAGVYLATSVSVLRQPVPLDDASAVAKWLDGRGFFDGYAQYWSASIITVQSRERVRVRPVSGVSGRLSANPYYASSEWFSRGTSPSRFVVLSTTEYLDGVDERVAVATFGLAAVSTDIGHYRILIWDYDIAQNLDLSRLS